MTPRASGTPRPTVAFNAVDKTIGMRLFQRRRLLGISQQALAGKAGISFQQVQKYEKGANRISASRLIEFSDILQTPLSWFLEGFGFGDTAPGHKIDSPLRDDGGKELVSRATLELLRAYYSISDPRVRKQLIALARAIGALETPDEA